MAAIMMLHPTNATPRLEILEVLFLKHQMSTGQNGLFAPCILLDCAILNTTWPFQSMTHFSGGWNATELARQNVQPHLFFQTCELTLVKSFD